MAPILTAEDVVRGIATECAHLDERGAVGIRFGTGGVDRVAIRRAIQAPAGAQADAPVAETDDAAVIAVGHKLTLARDEICVTLACPATQPS